MPTAAAKKVDAATKRWMRNPSDEAAVRNGCRMDEGRGLFAIWWIERHCRLYEGEGYAGEPVVLRGCHLCHREPVIPDTWEEAEPLYLERAKKHAACRRAGHALDWQFDTLARLFGWVRWSGKWNREIRRFRQASIWVSKKNKKTPTIAAIALYVACGDGEPGQKVFLAAKDGKQVRENLAKHVQEMLHRSPELESECGENKTTMQITHKPTSSVVLILFGSEGKESESKEGLNGSIIIDETHVVDRQFVSRISRAGISRSEPLQIDVSTAGNNPDGYGHERFVWAQEVENGTREDQELLAVIHAAPQDLSDADLAADPLKYGKLANPAMGHTVDPEEFLLDYHRSKESIYKLAEFKMYRLNIWQRSSNPWLNSGDWAKCKRDFTAADLEGRECSAGLDLSRTRDMSALVLVFPWEDGCYRILPFFWLPKQVAHDNNHLAPFLTWERQKALELTPGNVMDYGFIRTRFRELAGRFRIRRLIYDLTYAEETTQALEQGVVNAAGVQIEEGTGVEREAFPQTIMAYTAPCKDFERLILDGKLHHNGHPVMDWQVGHVQVRCDANDNIRPVKPKRGDVKKIDGVVSAVMALWDAQQTPTDVPRVEWF